MDQHQLTIVIAVILAVVVVAVIGFILTRKRRSQQLRERFGPEYDRVLKKEGEVRAAEGVLEMRAKRRAKFQIHPLPPDTPCRPCRTLEGRAIAVCG